MQSRAKRAAPGDGRHVQRGRAGADLEEAKKLFRQDKEEQEDDDEDDDDEDRFNLII